MKAKIRTNLPLVMLLLGFGSCQVAAVVDDGRVSTFKECADGWDSPSIGRQGACSHHGGVVKKTADNRTENQRLLSQGLKITCAALIALAVFLFFGADLKSVPIVEIEGERTRVPLTIAGEMRLVEVIRKDEHTYETVEDVALVACPEGRRKSIYSSKLKFRGADGKYRQELSVWIYTGRGQAGGYVARAFRWI